MSQALINANQKSRTEESMVSQGSYIPFFAEPPSMPELGIQFQRTPSYISITGAAANNSMVFKLPPGAGFLVDASVALTCTCPVATADLHKNTAFDIVRELQWESGGQPIITKTKNALLAQIKKWKGTEFRTFCQRYAKMLTPATELTSANTDASFLTYLPLVDTFLNDVEKALLLNVVKDLYLRITFDTQTASGLTNAITGISGELFTQSYMPKLSVYNEMVLKDWSKPFNMSMVNCYEESPTVLTDTTSGSMTFACPYLVSKTHVFVRSINQVGLPFIGINNITMNLAGVQFVSQVRTSRLGSLSAKRGVSQISQITSDTALGYDSDKIITIDWGVLCGRDTNSGTFFGDELRGCNLSIVCATANTTNDRLYVIHEYFQQVQYSPANGGGALAVVINN